ncbi:MAG: FG-GAP repeat domain-containing protein, partial [Planctomycetota bacterium]
MTEDLSLRRRVVSLLPFLLTVAAGRGDAQGYPVWTSPGPFLSGQFGADAANLGDVDADGIDDLAVLRPQSVHFISGATGSSIILFAPPLPTSPSPFRDIAGVGDCNGDGAPDIAVGVAGTGLFNDGTVRVHSGSSGLQLWSVAGGPSESLGRAVAGPGDLNGNGVPDVVAGGGSFVRALSGTNGAVLYT